MGKIGVLLTKSMATIKYEGFNSFVRKSYNFTKRKLFKKGNIVVHNSGHSICYKDVLFINGCTLPHPTRYRVDHQIEQLHFNGFSCDSIYYENLNTDMVKYYRTFVFFRCPHTKVIENSLNLLSIIIRSFFFDIDDLVIDYKYVKDIKHLKTMQKEQLELYMDGVERMKRTLLLCDYAITTTKRLADELLNYVPEVFINRNVASEKMVELSQIELKKKIQQQNNENKVVIGYFSGSITHNADFNLILPVIKKILTKYSNVYLKVVGFLDVPLELKEFENRIIAEKFVDWTELPSLISSVDINIAPLEQSVFNEAKSEIKWIEAALVRVPTIASNIGAFKEMIVNGETGILCSDNHEWEKSLDKLIADHDFRNRIGLNAYKYVMENCVSAYSGYRLTEFIQSKLKDNIAFVLPSTQISGGVNVVIKHCNILREAGKDVLIISMNGDNENIVNKDGTINVLSSDTPFHGYFAKCVATLWSTLDFINNYPKIRDKYYLVQNFETDFYEPGHIFRVWANLTYNSFNSVKYITISKWCEDWLLKKYSKPAKFARNGLDLSLFKFKERDFSGKVRILVEGNSSDYYKNVDESFKITNKLNKEKYEIWYLSYNGIPKDWYMVDEFMHKVPYDKVGEIYQSCHILIKSSILESFSYPPLEMMATGGIAVVAPNHGNVEYLVDGENCLLYEQGNIDHAVKLIEEVCNNPTLRQKLFANKTAVSRDWRIIEEEILSLYDFSESKKSKGGEIIAV